MSNEFRFEGIKNCPICRGFLNYVTNRTRIINKVQRRIVGIFFCPNCDMEIRMIKIEQIE